MSETNDGLLTKESAPATPNEGGAPEGRLERRWFWIALFSFVLLFSMHSSGVAMLFTLTIDEVLGEGVSGHINAVVAAAALFFSPLLLGRLGILADARRLRRFVAASAAVASVALIVFAQNNAPWRFPERVWPALLLQLIVVAVPAMIAGCAMHRAVQVISGRVTALFPGVVFGAMFASGLIDIFFYLVVVGEGAPWAKIRLFYPAGYILLLLIPVVLLLTAKDDIHHISPKPAALFSDALFQKFMILSVMLLLLDTCKEFRFYAGGDAAGFSNLFHIALLVVPFPGLLLITWLLKKGLWMGTIAASTLLYCLTQGLSIFIPEGRALGHVYAISNMLFDSGNVVFLLYIPLSFCVQRRGGANAVTGIVALWMVAETAINVVISLVRPGFVQGDIVIPGITFLLSIATIAYLFYLYGENNRIHIDALTASFKAENIVQVTKTVCEADMLEGFGLTPREKEVCTLLLKSLTIRQISGELGLSFSTVNGYYRSLYRKLDINSKAELFMRFGAKPDASPRA